MRRLNAPHFLALSVYYRDDIPRANQQWSAFGCSGEVRSANGYLILYREAPVFLAHALAYDKAECSFPAGLLELVEPVDLGGPVPLDDLDSADSAQLRLLTPGAPALERVQKGRRNIALFDAVRFWAYGAAKLADSYDDWLRSVEIRTLAENRRFPEPLADRHALTTGYSIAVWTWTTLGGEMRRRMPALDGLPEGVLPRKEAFACFLPPGLRLVLFHGRGSSRIWF